jgi:hypothetical protein
MAQDVPADAGDLARVLFGDLIEGRWDNASRQLDANLRRHVDADRTASWWHHVADSTGTVQHMGGPCTRRSGGYAVVDLPLSFETGEATGRVVLDRAGQAASLSLAYPCRHRLDPRPVHVFVLGNPMRPGRFHFLARAGVLVRPCPRRAKPRRGRQNAGS